MTRLLLIVSGCGLLVSVAALMTAAMLGPFSFRPQGGVFGDFGPDWTSGETVEGGGAQTTRTLAWTGGDELTLRVPAEVIYTQGPEAKLEIIGPARSVGLIEVDGGTIRLPHRTRNLGDITLRLTAPNVSSFEVQGASELTLHNYDQDRLEISIAGAADIEADGRAREAEVRIAGAGDVDLSRLPTETVEIHISGVGEATVAPSRRAEVHIAGAGEVQLTTRPPEVESHIMGPGSITYVERPADPRPAPTPNASAPKTAA